MRTILGYQVTEKLHESSNSLVYRTLRSTDGQSVILKMLKDHYPSPEKVAWFKREYEIIKNLELDGIIKAYSLENAQNVWAMTTEDFGGEALSRLIQIHSFSLGEFLKIAIQIVEILGQVHQKQTLHKDINPSNIVLNPHTHELKLIDFGLSTVISGEVALQTPRYIEGTLAYISPEQTGRMNRSIDYRTDFYSLGITFYQLLAKQLPFSTDDELELIHAHIAKKPLPLHELNTNIPIALSAIVSKLMAKNAEDRYQSAYGLKADLETCLQQYQTTGAVAMFPLASADFSPQLQISQKLYGRTAPLQQLLAGFDRVSQGSKELVLVAGESGIGKSTFVQEVYKPLTQQKGYFIAGKFEPLQRNMPYAAMIQAFTALVKQILAEQHEQIAIWQEKLVAALGVNAQVIIEVIPDLELIIGEQPTVAEAAPLEAQHRFNLVFQNFVRVFAQPEHPLVIFLDDLQWTDAASLKLLELMMASDLACLFLIGSYRSNEVDNTHPLMLSLNQQQEHAAVHTIVLSPLTLADLNHLAADTLNLEPEATLPLAEVIQTKTAGNPFYINELLQSLYQENLLRFDLEHHTWNWDLTQIQKYNSTNNVIDLMTHKLQKLERATQQVLQRAACISNQFDLQTLSLICQSPPQTVAKMLWPAITDGLILPLSDTYKLTDLFDQPADLEVIYQFAHDRIRQAAYELISETDHAAIHWQIGQLLQQATPPDINLFEVVNQLNLGRSLAQQLGQRDSLAQLNLLAGQDAKASAAYEPALKHFQIALELLPDCWQTHYDLALALHCEAAEAAYLSTDFEQMNQLAEAILQQAHTLLDKAPIYQIQIQGYIAQNQHAAAVQLARSVLHQLGVNLPEQPEQPDIEQELGAIQTLLTGCNIDDLSTLPFMSDPLQLAAMGILDRVIPAVYLTAPELYPILVCKEIELSLKYGNTAISTTAYANYGIILCGILEDIETGYQFGQLALKLLAQLPDRKMQARTLFEVNIYLIHWKNHLKHELKVLDAYRSGLEVGDIEYAAYAALMYCVILYLLGSDLRTLKQQMADYQQAIVNLKQDTALTYHNIYYQAVLNLLGESEAPCILIGKIYNETESLPLHLETNDISGAFYVYFNQLILGNLFQDYEVAAAAATAASALLEGVPSTPYVPLFYFYDSLTQLAIAATTDSATATELLAQVANNQEKMRYWADCCPENYQHKYDLVAAEQARVLSQHQNARDYYDRAIVAAQEQGFLNEAALAYELAGRFYLARGQRQIARYYLQDAYYAYQQWGAVAKTLDLEERYPQFLGAVAAQSVSSTTPSKPSSTVSTSQRSTQKLDLATILKASQAISGEIVLEKLLEKLMRIAIENAGAQRGFLLMPDLSRTTPVWVIEAAGAVDTQEVSILQSIPLDTVDATSQTPLISTAIVNYVSRTQETVVLDNAIEAGAFTNDPEVVATQARSILCTPLIHQAKISGILYLQNDLTPAAFTPDRIELLNMLSAQAAISIENSRLYRQLEDYSRTLEQKVESRTLELQEKNQELGNTLQKLKTTQAQIIAQEKLASLGALTAGIAHEIKNPLNFVNNFAELSVSITTELSEELATQSQQLDTEAREYIEELLRDLSQNAQKIKEHGQRADNIVHGMLMHSRGQPGERQLSDVNALLAEAVNLVYHGMRAKDPNFDITMEINYDRQLPLLKLVPQNISRAFLNILSNACDAAYSRSLEGIEPRLWVQTQATSDHIEIRIRDNGPGIPAANLERIFNPFFTTKPTGQGTGLGLSISHDIIVQEHQGSLQVKTEVGNYAEFIIALPKEYS